jgi:SAM-dependent methyltransferase
MSGENSSAPRAAGQLLRRRSDCRACGGSRLERVLDLGEVPLANAYLSESQLREPELRFPLEVFFCLDCSLLQLLHVVSPELLFSNYLYRTGTNRTIVEHNEGIAAAVTGQLSLSTRNLVVEIASNDGSLLSCFQRRGVRVLGVEPARNIARIARDAGVPTVNEFFGPASARRIASQHGRASAVLANNVLAHVDATADFLRACGEILEPEGRVVIEVPYLVEMLERLEYDTVYHEHLCYFSVNSLMRLFEAAGLALLRVDRVPIHGGSLRLWAAHSGAGGHSESARALAAEECRAGLDRLATYLDLARRVARQKEQLLALLRGLQARGKTIAGYGAPAKGNTLLCYCGIDASLIPYTVDRSPLKVGLFTPGSHIPILPVEDLFQRRPDFVLILAWNFAAEILETLRPLTTAGARAILPIPEPQILG